MNKLALFMLALCPLLPLQAASLGAVGQVFPITEIDMLQWIENRLNTFEKTGELQSMREQFQENVKAGVRRPRPIGLITTNTPEVFLVDPTLTLAKDITDIDGNLIYAKGTRVNPFDTATWPALQRSNVGQFQFSKTLVFFDGDDVQQVLWAKEFAATHKNAHKIKWILTGGEPETLHHQLQARIYFDQQGNISRALTVKRVPSIVKQEGVMWQVREVDVSNFPVFMEEVNHDAP
jgi:conjugal transfer pilus assembly protein TraW